MKRKMTFLALGEKCGGLGDSGWRCVPGARATPALPSDFINDANATAPRLKPQALRNCRRVCCQGEKIGFIKHYSRVMNSSRFKTARDTAIQVANRLSATSGGHALAAIDFARSGAVA